MARNIRFNDGPWFVALTLLKRFVETRTGVSGCANVRLPRNLLAPAGELDRLHEAARRVRGCLFIDQSPVLFIDKKELRLGAFQASFTLFKRSQHRGAAGFGQQVNDPVTILVFERVEPDDRTDAVTDLVERARGRETGIGMGDKADVVEALPFDYVHDIRDVSVEIDVFAQQM